MRIEKAFSFFLKIILITNLKIELVFRSDPSDVVVFVSVRFGICNTQSPILLISRIVVFINSQIINLFRTSYSYLELTALLSSFDFVYFQYQKEV